MGKRILVKICGITSPQDARLAAEEGADAVGLVFWPGSPRCVDLETARRIGEALPPSVLRVGVFVNAARDALCRAADAAGLDVLQLHGDETPADLADLPRKVWKAVRVGNDFTLSAALRYKGRAAAILLDTRAEEAPGGTGRRFDWSLVAPVRKSGASLILAGGLNPENIRSAIEAVHPDGVDVSSGVESAPRRKDAQKVRAFIAAVRSLG